MRKSVKDWFFLVYLNTKPVRGVSQELVWLCIFYKERFNCWPYIFWWRNVQKKYCKQSWQFFLKHTLFLHCRLANGKNASWKFVWIILNMQVLFWGMVNLLIIPLFWQCLVFSQMKLLNFMDPLEGQLKFSNNQVK